MLITVPATRSLWSSVRLGSGRASRAMLAFVALTVAACGDSAGPDAPVEGELFILQTVNGSALPARFEPADVPGLIDDARISGGSMAFVSADRVNVTEDYMTPDGLTDNWDYSAMFIQSGSRVLIYANGPNLPPDTATVSGNALSVRAQFYREPTDERYVLTMVYRRN